MEEDNCTWVTYSPETELAEAQTRICSFLHIQGKTQIKHDTILKSTVVI